MLSLPSLHQPWKPSLDLTYLSKHITFLLLPFISILIEDAAVYDQSADFQSYSFALDLFQSASPAFHSSEASLTLVSRDSLLARSQSIYAICIMLILFDNLPLLVFQNTVVMPFPDSLPLCLIAFSGFFRLSDIFCF